LKKGSNKPSEVGNLNDSSRITRMNLAPPLPELMPGATNAVETCLAVRPDERVALISDEATKEVTASLASALTTRHAHFTSMQLEEFGSRPMAHAPKSVLDELERADVGVLCMRPQQGELGLRMEIVRVVERRQIRYAHMVGVTPEIMRQGMRADYKMVDCLSERLRERMLRAENAHRKNRSWHEDCGAF